MKKSIEEPMWTTTHRCARCEERFTEGVRGSEEALNQSLVEICVKGNAQSVMIGTLIHDCEDGGHGLAPVTGIIEAPR